MRSALLEEVCFNEAKLCVDQKDKVSRISVLYARCSSKIPVDPAGDDRYQATT